MKNKELTFSFLTIGVALFLDFIFIVTADYMAFFINFQGHFPTTISSSYLNLCLFILAVRYVSFYVFKLYNKPIHKSNFEILINVVKACTASSVIIISYLYFLNIRTYPSLVVILSWFLTILFVSSWRIIIKEFIGLCLGKDFFKSHLLIIGTGSLALRTAIQAQRNATIEYNLLGFIDSERDPSHRVKKSEILGTLNDIPSIIENYHIDEVMIAEERLDKQKIADLLQLLNKKRIFLKSIPAAYETVIKNIVLSGNEAPFVGTTTITGPSSWYWGVKRIFDIILSIIILVTTLPILLLAMVLVKTTSPGPVLYFQKRMGRNGCRFSVAKLRTMFKDAEKDGKPRWAEKNDSRITPIGRCLRLSRIDELPQLINVLKNEMSLIGPRPERPYFYSKLIKKVPFYAERLLVKPGLSGWAQVNFRYAASAKDAEEKLLYDLYYIQNMSLALDVLIALKTLKVILTGRGAQ